MKNLNMTLGLLPVITILAGCTSSPEPEPQRSYLCGIQPVTEDVEELYRAALLHWTEAQAQLGTDPAQRESLRLEMVRRFEEIEAIAPELAVAYGLHARFLAGGNEQESRQADACYRRALGVCEIWSPAWIGLARLALQRGNPDEANAFLDRALESLDALDRTDTWTTQSVPGSGLAYVEAYRLVQNQWTEEMRWDVSNRFLLNASLPSSVRSVQRHIEATVHVLRARAAALAGRGRSERRRLLDRARQVDPQHYEAALECARLDWEEQEFDRGMNRLRPYLKEDHVMARRDPALHSVLARLIGSRALREPTFEHMEEARSYFERMAPLVPFESDDPYLGPVRELFVALQSGDRAGVERAKGHAHSLRLVVPMPADADLERAVHIATCALNEEAITQ